MRAPVLKTFDEHKDVLIQTDASSSGLGAVLQQDEQAAAYAIHTLTKTKICYSQTKKGDAGSFL